MIVEELRLRNWRGHRNQRAFRFGSGLNLVIGPNESGKSTLFEALVRVLFDRHNSRARELERIRPLGSSLGPEVQLILRSGGVRYRVLKRFLSDPLSELWAEREGGFELDHEGDRADEAVRELLRGERSARGATQPVHRGLAHALWYLQSDEALPRGEWSSALQEGLEGLMRLSLRTPRQDAVLAALGSEYASLFTPTGRVAKTGELFLLQSELPRLEAELGAVRAELERVSRHRGELVALTERRLELEGAIATQRCELDQVDAGLAVSGAVEERERSAAGRCADAARGLDERLRLMARIDALRVRVRQLGGFLVASEELESKLRVAAREHRREAEVHARRWEEELEPKRGIVRRQIEELRAKRRIEQLEEQERELVARAQRRCELEGELAELDARVSCLAAPDDATWREIGRLRQQLRVLAERVRGGAIGVRFELGDLDVTVDPPAAFDPETGEYLVTRAVTLRIGELGSVHLRAPGSEAERFEREAEAGERELRSLLRAFGGEVEVVEPKVEARRDLESQRTQVRARLAELGKGSGDGRLLEVREELSALRARVPQAVLPGLEGWAEERTLEQMRELERRLERLDAAVREAREEEQRSDREYHARQGELNTTIQQTATLRSNLQAVREQVAEALGNEPDQDALGRALGLAKEELDAAQAALVEAKEELRRRVEEPRQRRAFLAQRLGELERARAAVETEIVDRGARIEEAVDRGVSSRLDDLEGRRQGAQQRLARVERRSAAIKLLQQLAVHHLERRARALVEPVSDLVDGWLERLTGRSYRGLALDQRLVPIALQPSRYDEALPLESLSFGTYEQVVVLLRLAVGVLLSREERQLVILDDRLVNADSGRMLVLREILAEAAQSCQILLATCDGRAYDGLEARRLVLGEGIAVEGAPVLESGSSR